MITVGTQVARRRLQVLRACSGPSAVAGRLERPDLHDTVCHSTWRLGSEFDCMFKTRSLDDGKARDWQIRRKKGPCFRLHTRRVGIANLDGFSSNAHDSTHFDQLLVMAMCSIANRFRRPIISRLVSVSDRYKFGHRRSLYRGFLLILAFVVRYV